MIISSILGRTFRDYLIFRGGSKSVAGWTDRGLYDSVRRYVSYLPPRSSLSRNVSGDVDSAAFVYLDGFQRCEGQPVMVYCNQDHLSCLAPTLDPTAVLSCSNASPRHHCCILCGEQSSFVPSSAPTPAFSPAPMSSPSCLLGPLRSALWSLYDAFACRSLRHAPSQFRSSKLPAPYPPGRRHRLQAMPCDCNVSLCVCSTSSRRMG